MKEPMVVDSVASKDTMIAPRLATHVVVSVLIPSSLQSHEQVIWRRIVLKVKNAITVVVWDTLAEIAIKLLKQKFATGLLCNSISMLIIGVNNPGISPATVPTNKLSKAS
jgi:hypothetical protein